MPSLGRAGVLSQLIRLITHDRYLHFIPAMVELQGGGLPGPEAVAAATRWGQLNYLRHALTLAGWQAALKAFSLRGR